MIRSIRIALLILVVVIVNTMFNNAYAAQSGITVYSAKLAPAGGCE